jgi:hypothetical protein
MENKYNPLTEQEYLELKSKIDSIKDYLPESLLGYTWDNYKKISGSNENQPCGCKSAGGLWLKAVTVLREYLNKVDTIV